MRFLFNNGDLRHKFTLCYQLLIVYVYSSHSRPFISLDIIRRIVEELHVYCMHVIKYIEVITRLREDIDFMFEWQEQYLATRT